MSFSLPIQEGQSVSDLRIYPLQGRGGLGVKLMDLREGESISSVAIIGEEQE